MKHLTSIDHVGYAVKDIMLTAQHYISAGWTVSEIFEENIQNTKIVFLKKDGFPLIELVSPLDESKSPVDNIIKNNGVSTYHICYNVDNMDSAVEDLYDEGFNPLFMPVESVAMGGQRICYLYNSEVGLIEIVGK